LIYRVNKISLDIVNTIIISCADYINLFANNALKIILCLLETGDPGIQIQASDVVLMRVVLTMRT